MSIALKRLKVLIEKLKETNSLKEISNVITQPNLYSRNIAGR
jgi:hypothetical protein